MESGKISTTVTPSNTPIISESPVTTQPPVTEPVPSPKLPTLTFHSSSVNGMSVTIYGNAQSGAGKQLGNISWNWGDGQSSIGQFPQIHTYAQYGTYTVTAIVTDAGLSASSTTSVTVSASSVQQTNPPTTEPTETIHVLISVKTDSNSYKEGETIVISGKVSLIITGTPVTMQIFIQDDLVDIAQITVAEDGSYSHLVRAEGPLWSKAGEYIVQVAYGGVANAVAKTSFEYSGTTGDTLQLDPLPPTVKALDTIVFSGQFIASDKNPISGRTINIKDDVDFFSDNLVSVAVTDDNGRFYVTWTAYPRGGNGAYDFYAVFEGDSNYGHARSHTYSVTVN